jgi:hypothetical protein
MRGGSGMIEDLKTGRLLPSEILPVSSGDLESLGPGWNFDWAEQIEESETYKLFAAESPNQILGMMSIRRETDFIEVILIESNPDDVGREKRYRGIPGNLLAFAANLSLELGNEGFLRLLAKTELIYHYVREYGFSRHRNSQILILNAAAAARLISTFLGRPGDGTTPRT